MTLDTKSPSLISLLTLVKTLKRDSERHTLSVAEREEKIAAVIEKLAAFQPLPFAVQTAPMTLSAEER